MKSYLGLPFFWGSVGAVIALGCARTDFLVTPRSAGRIKIGMTNDEVRRGYPNHVMKEAQGEGCAKGLALQLYSGQDLLLTLEFNEEGRVYRASTMNSRFVTREGIRIGTTLGEAKRHLGDPVYLGPGDGGVYAVFDFKEGRLSFRLQIEPNLLLGRPADQSKILEILVVDS